MTVACAFVGTLALLVLEETFNLHDWLTGRDRDAEFIRFQAEQHARLWTDGNP